MMNYSKKVAAPKKSAPIPTVDEDDEESQFDGTDVSSEDDELPF